jgi:hypothetical protein
LRRIATGLAHGFCRRAVVFTLTGLSFFGGLNDLDAADAAPLVGTKLPGIPGKDYNDVAVDSRGTIYVTTKDGNIYFLRKGGVFTLIPNRPAEFAESPAEIMRITYKALRIAIAPEGNTPWVVFFKDDRRTVVGTGVQKFYPVNILCRLGTPTRQNPTGWFEREGAPEPADVTIAAEGTIYVTAEKAPWGVFSTTDSHGTTPFRDVMCDDSSRISAGTGNTLWVVKRDGSLWGKGNPVNSWKPTSSVAMQDVGASHFGRVVGLAQRKRTFLGIPLNNNAIWQSTDYGNTFVEYPQNTGFLNVAASSANILYAVDAKATLWKFR